MHHPMFQLHVFSNAPLPESKNQRLSQYVSKATAEASRREEGKEEEDEEERLPICWTKSLQ